MPRRLLITLLAVGTSIAAIVVPAPSTSAQVQQVPSFPVVVRGTTWYVRDALTAESTATSFTFGEPGDVPIMGDWDGNGTFTPGVVHGNRWYLRNSDTTGPADIEFSYGDASDTPIVGDWDGNGTFTPGVVRGSAWYLRNSNTTGAGDLSFTYGNPGDVVIAGDWDGNGTSTPGVIRGSVRYLRNSNSRGLANTTLSYGSATDKQVVGDWDGNGTTTPGVVRGGVWYLRNSNTTGVANLSFRWGNAGDLPLSTESAVARDRGGKPLAARYVGAEVSVLPTSAKVVALTFDAGANANGLAKILATLQRENVPATFFLTGAWTRQFPAEARQIGLRYAVGNHTDTHPHLPQLTDAQIRDQLRRAHDVIAATARYDPHPMFRFPFGDRDSRTLGIANAEGYANIYWTVDTLGWQGTSGGRSVSSVVSRVLGGLRPGEIVLMHVGSNPDDGSTLDADALPTIISSLRSRGYSFVTVMQYM